MSVKGYGNKEMQLMWLARMPVKLPLDDSLYSPLLTLKENGYRERSLKMPNVHLADGYDSLLCAQHCARHWCTLTQTTSSRLLQSAGSSHWMT